MISVFYHKREKPCLVNLNESSERAVLMSTVTLGLRRRDSGCPRISIRSDKYWGASFLWLDW